MATVSVIIPAFNRAHTLGRALDSILAQKEVSLEIVVVDDGSTDGTRELVARFMSQHGEIRYLHQANQGPAAARNAGILNARSNFIAFLDSDDEWLPGKLRAQLRFFEENPDYLIAQTEEIWIRSGRRVNPMKKHKKYGGWIFDKCLPLCIVSPSAVMMKRELIMSLRAKRGRSHLSVTYPSPPSGGRGEEVSGGLFDESLPACEDYDLWLRVSARFPIGLIEKPYVVKYGGHPDQRSRQFPVMDRFRIQALQKMIGSGILTDEQNEAAMRELKRKSDIVRRGALKRGKDVTAPSLQGREAHETL